MEAVIHEHEEHNNNSFNQAFRTILISLITVGVTWLVYTTIDNKAQLELMDYKIGHISKTVDEINKKVK